MLSKILVGSIGGALGLFARGASQKKCSSPAHIGPPAFLAFSMSAFTASESGLAGEAAGGCAYNQPMKVETTKTACSSIFSLGIGPPAQQFYRTTPPAGSRTRLLNVSTSSAGAQASSSNPVQPSTVLIVPFSSLRKRFVSLIHGRV